MAMSKQNYVMIARQIRASIESIRCRENISQYWVAHMDGGIEALENFAKRLCEGLLDDNPNFDKDKFLVACGVLEPDPKHPHCYRHVVIPEAA